MSARLAPHRALAHPAWWCALSVLALNDHVLKGCELVPAPITGKLSDFAGLFVAPALFATVVGARSRRAVFVCHVAVGLLFAAIKLVPFARDALCGVLAAFGIGAHSVLDATDLVALVAVVAAHRVLVPRMIERPLAGTPHAVSRLELSGACAGLLLCTASMDAAATYMPEVSAPDGSDSVLADAYVFVPDGVSSSLSIGIQWADEYLDCESLLRDPKSVLKVTTFRHHAEDERLGRLGGRLPSGRVQALWPIERPPESEKTCAVVTLGGSESTWFNIDSRQLDLVYVIWDTKKLPLRFIPSEPDDERSLPPGALVVREAAGKLVLEPRGPIVVVPMD